MIEKNLENTVETLEYIIGIELSELVDDVTIYGSSSKKEDELMDALFEIHLLSEQDPYLGLISDALKSINDKIDGLLGKYALSLDGRLVKNDNKHEMDDSLMFRGTHIYSINYEINDQTIKIILGLLCD